MKQALFLIISLFAVSAGTLFAQPPGGRGGERPRDDRPYPKGPEGRRDGEWMRPVDTNGNGAFETEEFQAALDRTFAEFDRNGNKTLDPGETKRPLMGPPDRPGQRPQDGDGRHLLPPFFFLDLAEPDGSYSKADFERIAKRIFADMDANHDGSISRDEARRLPPKPPGIPDGPRARGPEAPNARFIAADARFGDRLVKGAPFSAETVIEENRRLFDGTTVTKERRGAFYRDGEGRTRREQPLENVGGVSIVGADNKPQLLIFINDFAMRQQIFLDVNNKIARRNPIGPGNGPLDMKPGANEEKLGTRTIEGVVCEGTRVTFDIPAGSFGNDKPMKAITERWFSKDLQVLVMSRHLDPVVGEHIFRLVNIKRVEPNPELFAIPNGYRVEQGGRRPGE